MRRNGQPSLGQTGFVCARDDEQRRLGEDRATSKNSA